MSTRSIVTVIGTAVGAYFGYPQLGYAVGSLVGNAIDPQQIKGPKLEDLKVAALEYGAVVSHVYGSPRLAGAVIWSSDKMEVETTTSDKGGPEVTNYSYKQDVLFLLASNQQEGVRRIWSNGKLIWTLADDSDPESIAASATTSAWESVEVFSGAPDQLPWTVYEAAVGVGSAPAMRGRFTLGITGLNLGGSGYAPQLTFELGTIVDSDTLEATPADLADVVEDQCVLSGLPLEYIDVEDLRGIPVRAFAISQVTPARQVIETLMAAYFFTAVESDTLKFVLRGGPVQAALYPASMGAGQDQADAGELVPLSLKGDTEIPTQVAIVYADADNDYQSATEYSDRILSEATGVANVQLPIAFKPVEAKRIADISIYDLILLGKTIGPIRLSNRWSHLQPSDVLQVYDREGNSFRVRVTKIADDGGVRVVELVFDSAHILQSAAMTDGTASGSLVVNALPATLVELLDIPIQRDADNEAGFYAAFSPAGPGTWPGASFKRGVDDAGYTEVAQVTDKTAIGQTTTALGPWTGGAVFDEVNRVTVEPTSRLFSYTRTQILEGSAPAYIVGAEELYARTAVDNMDGTYTLSGLLRGRRGTEWATDSHVIGDRFVRLQTAGLRRVVMETSQLGILYSYKAVTPGKTLAETAEHLLANAGVGLKPFAPVALRVSDTTGGNTTLAWTGRTRLSTRFTGPIGVSTPQGEAPLAYSVDRFDLDGTTLLSTDTVTAPTITYTGSIAGQTVRVYQLSATVGRGYPVELVV